MTSRIVLTTSQPADRFPNDWAEDRVGSPNLRRATRLTAETE